MQRIFWVQNGDLEEVNRWLLKGGKVKMIHALSESIASYGYAGGESNYSGHGSEVGDIYAYIVVEFD